MSKYLLLQLIITVHCTKSYIYSQKSAPEDGRIFSPETYWADLKRLINENFVASCWLFTSLYSGMC